MTDNRGLSPTEVEALFTETFTTHSSTTPTQVTNTIEQMFDSLVPYFTEVTHPQKRSRHPKVLTFTTDHKQMWAYLRSQQSEIAGCVMFDLSCAARDLGMTQNSDYRHWRSGKCGLDNLSGHWQPRHWNLSDHHRDIETIVSLCSSITYAQPTTLTMDALRGARLLH